MAERDTRGTPAEHGMCGVMAESSSDGAERDAPSGQQRSWTIVAVTAVKNRYISDSISDSMN